MLDILKHILFVYIISMIIDFVIICGITYLFTKDAVVSVLVALLSSILMCIKGKLINELLLS